MMEETGNYSRLRLEWLDALKGFAILSVVLGHVLLGYSENNMFPEINSKMQVFMKWIYTWHMPLFFAISGFSFSLSYFENQKVNIRKIVRGGVNLFLIYLIFSMTLGVLKIVFASLVDNPMDIREFVITIFLPNTLMWYLWVLILFYIFFGVIMNGNGSHMFLPLVLLFFAGRILAESFSIRLCIRNLLCCAVFFYMGINFAVRGVELYMKKTVLPAMFLMVLLFAGFYTMGYSAYTGLPILLKSLLEICNATSIIFILFGVFPSLSFAGIFQVLVQLGKASLVIYLTHTYIVTALKVAVRRSGFENGVIAITLTWCIAVITSYLVYLASRKIKVIGYIFKPIRLADIITKNSSEK